MNSLFLIYAVLGGLAVMITAAPATVSYAVHEKRDISASYSWWQRRDLKLDRHTTISMSIALTQRNLELGPKYLMEVSNPASENYGKHWLPKKVAETFYASEETITTVKSWLETEGISEERIKLSNGRNWIKFEATIEEAEHLLRTEYKVYESMDGMSKRSLATDDYSVPLTVKDHIDFITPTIQFDVVLSKPRKRAVPTTEIAALKATPVLDLEPEKLWPLANNTRSNSTARLNPTDLSMCDKFITTECLRALYCMPNGTLANSSLAIIEYTPQSYIPSDLTTFLRNVDPWIPYETQPHVDLVDGAVLSTDFGNYYTESNLDLQLALPIVYPQEVSYIQVGDPTVSASFNTFLDAIDSTYCTQDGGDDPQYDPIYPDNSTGGYNGHDCGTLKPASVISTSYSANEASLSPAYVYRQCNEYMKLGLQGITVLYSTGDYGVAGNKGQCCVYPGCADGILNNGSGGSFNPSAAPSCPYVTAVGATRINPGSTVLDPESAANFSAGGFSNIFPIPEYQKDAVTTYLTNYTPPYNYNQFNNSGYARAFPDISANGVNSLIILNGTFHTTGGTSASCPIVAALFTLINEQLIAAGKPVVGFANPVLYAHPEAMNDITTGNAPGCGTDGFTAVPGWDPITGLGTPDYVRLLDVFMNIREY